MGQSSLLAQGRKLVILLLAVVRHLAGAEVPGRAVQWYALGQLTQISVLSRVLCMNNLARGWYLWFVAFQRGGRTKQ